MNIELKIVPDSLSVYKYNEDQILLCFQIHVDDLKEYYSYF